MNRETTILFTAMGGVAMMVFVLINFFEPPSDHLFDSDPADEYSESDDSSDNPDKPDKPKRTTQRGESGSRHGFDRLKQHDTPTVE